MLKEELGKVKKNRLLMITLIVVMLIPSIYSTIFLKSMWDTYERMDSFPVAVVNHDKPAEKEGKQVNIGEELTKTLETSDDMDFNIMSAEEASEGLDAGKYYMAITIPEDFSSDSLTVMDKNPKPMNLTYETSAGHNFTASKFSEIAAGRIKAQVQEKVTHTYAQTVLSQFKKAGVGLQQAGDGADTLSDGLGQLKDGSGKLDEGATKLNNGLGEFSTGLGTYTNGVGTAAAGSQKLADGGSQLQSGIAQYTGGVDQAATKAPDLLAGLNKYTGGVNQIAAGAPGLVSGINEYTNGVDKAAAGAPGLVSGINDYTNGVKKAAAGAPGLASGISDYTNGVNQLAANSPKLVSGIDQYTAGVSEAKAGSKQVADGLTQLNESLHSDDVTKLTAGMDEYKKQVAQLKSMSEGSTPEQQQILASMEGLATQIQTLGGLLQSPDLSAKDRATLMDSVTESKKNLETLQAALKTQAEKAGQLGGLADGYDQLYAGMTGYVQKTQDASAKLAPGASAVNAGLGQLTDKNDELNSGAKQVAGGLNQLQANSGKLNEGGQTLAGGLNQLQANSGKLNAGGQTLAGGLNQLQANSGKLNAGSQTLAGGLNQLQANSGALTGGTQQLVGGLQTLQSKNGQLQDGANQAVGGINQLNSGLNQLNANSGRLQSAVGQLSDGSGQLADGAGQLSVGLVKANDGSDELGSKLHEGADKVKQVRDDKKNLDMFASPIKETHSDRTEVKNNGTGMAPYMISIYVFVGMITLMATMNLTEPSAYPKTGLAWWLSKYTIPFVLVFVGAIITTLVSVALIGLTPVNPVAFLVTLIVMAIMDMSIVFFFTASLGKIGTFISLILLVLQLSGSGGTYPIQLSSGFFQWLHTYLPMTYAVDALRGSLSTGLSVVHPVTVMFLIFVAFSLMSWAYFAIQKSKRYRFEGTDSTEK
ncbi:YhgE/Pip domain-containing protein [Weissella ceti]|nr:YhgE/Pip domain-containing protein [Weissella ceti]